MTNMTIKTRLIALSSVLILLLIGLSLYMRNEIVNGQTTMETGGSTLNEISAILQESSQKVTTLSVVLQNVSTTLKTGNQLLEQDVQASKDLARATETLLTFADLKFWLSDLEVSWLMESEEKAETMREKLTGLIKSLEGITPAKDIQTLTENVNALYDVSIEAVDAYVDENRVLGNSLVAKGRVNIATVEGILLALSSKLRKESEAIKKQTVVSALKSVSEAEAASKEAVQAVTEMTSTVSATSKAVELSERAITAAKNASTASIVTLLIVIPIAIILTWLVIRSVTNPLIEMTKSMSKLATGETKINIPALGRTDEIGHMATAVQVFRANMVENAKLNADKATEAQRIRELQLQQSLKMADLLEEKVLTSVLTVESSTNELHSALEGLNTGANHTSELSVSAENTSDNMASKMQTIASATEELAASIREISNQVSHSSAIATKAVDQAGKSTEHVSSLSTAADQIGDIIGLIENIAEQTKLLSLNATIEAARAGEAGKGFAVVASEVKVLANQTSEATDKITVQVNAMRAATSLAAEGITTITDTISSIEQATETITHSVEQQDNATREISLNIQDVAKDSKSVTDNVSSINKSAREASASSTASFDTAKTLKESMLFLKEEVNSYLKYLRESSANNHRDEKPHAFNNSITVRWNNREKIFQTKDLSLTGCLLITDREHGLPLDDLVRIELPNIGQFNARVRGITPDEIAMEFSGLTPAHKDLLQAALDSADGQQTKNLARVA